MLSVGLVSPQVKKQEGRLSVLHSLISGSRVSNARMWVILCELDASEVDHCREAGCPRCGGVLDVANYPRKLLHSTVDLPQQQNAGVGSQTATRKVGLRPARQYPRRVGLQSFGRIHSGPLENAPRTYSWVDIPKSDRALPNPVQGLHEIS